MSNCRAGDVGNDCNTLQQFEDELGATDPFEDDDDEEDEVEEYITEAEVEEMASKIVNLIILKKVADLDHWKIALENRLSNWNIA